MKIYVSGTFTAQDRLRDEGDSLRDMGHDVISSWLYESAKPVQLNTPQWNLSLADKDIAEVFAADVIILDLDGESTTGGRYVEWGVSCHPLSHKLRYLIGGINPGVFDSKAHKHFETWRDLRAFFFVNHNAQVK